MAFDANGNPIHGNHIHAEDFERGDKFELYCADLLVKKFGWEFIHQTEGNFPDYDLEMKRANGKPCLVECKEDRMCVTTNNVCLEKGYWFEKRSGLSITKAGLYIYGIHRPDGSWGIYAQATEKFNKKIMRGSYIGDGPIRGGNNKSAVQYLFKYDVFIDGLVLLDDSSYHNDRADII